MMKIAGKRSAEGGSRTHNPQGNASLSRARLPVPPLRHGKESIPKNKSRVKMPCTPEQIAGKLCPGSVVAESGRNPLLPLYA